MFQYVSGRHNNINTQTVYTATKQTSCNNNHFIALKNCNVLKTINFNKNCNCTNVI